MSDAALTAGRRADRKGSAAIVDDVTVKQKGSTTIYPGAIVAIDSGGFAKPAVTATGLTVIGICTERAASVNSGADGSVSVSVRRGCHKVNNSSADPVGQANLFKTVYAVNDNAVAATDGTGTRSAAGKLVKIDSDGVWVEMY